MRLPQCLRLLQGQLCSFLRRKLLNGMVELAEAGFFEQGLEDVGTFIGRVAGPPTDNHEGVFQ